MPGASWAVLDSYFALRRARLPSHPAAARLVLVIYLLGGLAEGNDLKWGELSWNGDGLGPSWLLLEALLELLGRQSRVRGAFSELQFFTAAQSLGRSPNQFVLIMQGKLAAFAHEAAQYCTIWQPYFGSAASEPGFTSWRYLEPGNSSAGNSRRPRLDASGPIRVLLGRKPVLQP